MGKYRSNCAQLVSLSFAYPSRCKSVDVYNYMTSILDYWMGIQPQCDILDYWMGIQPQCDILDYWMGIQPQCDILTSHILRCALFVGCIGAGCVLAGSGWTMQTSPGNGVLRVAWERGGVCESL